MWNLVGMLFLLLSTVCLAESRVLEIPDQGWKVQFDAPSTVKIKETNNPSQYYYLGNADRFNLSLIVEAPTCEGGSSVEAFLQCILPKFKSTPGLVKEPLVTKSDTGAVQVIYLTYVPFKDSLIKVMNTHMLFSYRGKWGDLHASVIKPTPEEFKMLLSIGNSFSYSDI